MAEPGWFKDSADGRLARWFDGEAWTEHTLVMADWQGPGSPPPPTIEPERVPAFPVAPTAILPVPPTPPPPLGYTPTVVTSGSTMSRAAERYKGWPLWARIAAPAAIALLLIGAVGSAGGSKKTDLQTAAPTTTTSIDETTSTAVADTSTTVTTAAALGTVGDDDGAVAPAPTTGATTAPTVAPTTTRPAVAPATTAAPQAVVATTAPNCDPNYSGCLNPNSPDYDCAGGSGNGPDYTGPVRVLGNDHYDLDSDHDGYACEDS